MPESPLLRSQEESGKGVQGSCLFQGNPRLKGYLGRPLEDVIELGRLMLLNGVRESNAASHLW